MRTVRSADYMFPPAPQGFPQNAEVFICRARADTYDYCGGWALKNRPLVHKFIIPGSIRSDGFFSDPLEARDALNKYLEGLKR